jgi:prolyl oligopeptidase
MDAMNFATTLRRGLAGLLTAAAALGPPGARAQSDPEFGWLEDVHGAAALAWVAARNTETEARFASDPRHAGELERFLRLAQGDGRDEYVAGGYAHQMARDAGHPLGTWRVMRVDGRGPSHWRDALSLDELARREGTRWQFRPGWLNPTCDSRIGTRCLLALSPDGGDRTVLREFDLKTGGFVDPSTGGFATTAPARSVVAWIDRDHLLIESDFGPGSLSGAGYATQARVWTRGRPLSEARLVFQAPADAVLFILHAMISDGPPLYLAEVWLRGAPSPEYWRMSLDRPAIKLALPGAVVQYRGIVGVLGGKLIAMTAEPVALDGRTVRAGSLLALDGAGHEAPQLVFEPDATQAIDPIFHLAMARDRLWFVAMKDVDAHLYSALPSKGRWAITEHPLPPHAAVQLLTGENTQRVVMAKVETLLLPPTTMLFGGPGAPETISTMPPLFDASLYTTEQRFATSRDGTRVPYYLMHGKGFRFDGSAPGLVSAYGGFGVSWLPSYANHEFKTDIGLPVLERGGVFVQANIRGGGEYGPAWHEGARRALRQNGLDDLAAVAQDLVRIHAVASDRLAMIGGSNGGLLAAATGIQSPRLFKALIAEVPLTDMLRFHKLYTGSVWVNEYGDPDDPTEAAALARYSPLQNVKAGVAYPEMLLVTSTSDDRVHPGHARRLAEKLRSVGRPVLFYEATEGGHESLASPQRQAELRALETIYLLQALEIDR